MKTSWVYTVPLLILCFITCLSFLLIFGLSGWRFLVFFTFNTALSIVISKSTKSSDDDILFEVIVSSFAYEDEEVSSSCEKVDDDEFNIHVTNETNDCECMAAPDVVDEHVDNDEDSSNEQVDDDLERRSEEFIGRGRQRWREEMEREKMSKFE
ncbi:hypothetical protein L2E82_50330 [Cichorium intybus]|nr:hypothetical protein L2E82_50330 [Cichorium intybus]